MKVTGTAGVHIWVVGGETVKCRVRIWVTGKTPKVDKKEKDQFRCRKWKKPADELLDIIALSL